jgi:glycosyltransferase involved in cell wall biosynthesis
VATPDVSVVLAVHNGDPYLRQAVEGVLRQTHDDIELVVVDDASTDGSAAYLAGTGDERLRVVANEEQLGLAASLNIGLRAARARYVARMDADDVPFPEWLLRLRRRMESAPTVAIVGSAMLDVDATGRPGRLHRLPLSAAAVRWHALFSSPFFHSTVLVDREVLERNELMYDASRLESEDYDLWSRLLAVSDGANVPEALVLHRVHAQQASARRRALQVRHQREIALLQIDAVAPGLPHAELAWAVGTGRRVDARAGEAYLELYRAFVDRYGVDREVRGRAAAAVARTVSLRTALGLEPTLPVSVARRRLERGRDERRGHGRAARLLRTVDRDLATRVAVVSPEPTPYRAPLFDAIARRREVDLTVIYAAPTVAGRHWLVEPRHRAVLLHGRVIPGLRPVFRHDYPVTPGIVRALGDADPDVVLVSGWSTFASQAAIAWCRVHDVPYVLLVESHDLGPRAAWRRAVKDAVVPPLVRGAAGWLAIGTLAGESLVARGAVAERIRIFANTIDVDGWAKRADELAPRRAALRRELGATEDDLVVLSVGRLAPEKGFTTLLAAAARLAEDGVVVTIAGSGPQQAVLDRRAGARVRLLGEVDEPRLARLYVAADVFALLSTHEPWGVVVNEAAASALPLVLSDRVGAAHDLLRDGENGYLVPANDPQAAAAALRLLQDPRERRRAGMRSLELVREWGYAPSVEAFVAAVREAAISR